MVTDPISDLLTRIRNAQLAKHEGVSVPYSRLKFGIVKILYEEGYVGPFKVEEKDGGRKEIQISIRYVEKRKPFISMISRQSRPGRRYYVGYRDLKPVRNGMGIAILSTPKGVLSDREAREEKVGGEVLCKVW